MNNCAYMHELAIGPLNPVTGSLGWPPSHGFSHEEAARSSDFLAFRV